MIESHCSLLVYSFLCFDRVTCEGKKAKTNKITSTTSHNICLLCVVMDLTDLLLTCLFHTNLVDGSKLQINKCFKIIEHLKTDAYL